MNLLISLYQVALQLLFSLGKFCLQPLNIGIMALNPTRGTELGPGFRAFVLSCLVRKPETGRSPVKVSYHLSKQSIVSE